MYRKLAALMLGVTLALTLTLPVFANDSDTAFEVVEPAFGSSNEVVTKNLLINISIYEEIPLEMTLVRVEPSIRDAVVRDKISSLQDTTAYMMPILPAEDFEGVIVESIEVPFEVQDFYEEEDRRDIAETYLEALEEKQSAEEEFIRAYNKYTDSFYVEEAEAIVIGEALTFYEQEVINEYHSALSKMVKANYIYEKLGPVYDSIFETVVLGPETVEKEGVLPFYKTVIEDIKPGDYKLIFESDDEIIDVQEFTVKEPKEINEEEIKEEMTNIRKNFLSDTKEKK
jgi:hypothetical protein